MERTSKLIGRWSQFRVQGTLFGSHFVAFHPQDALHCQVPGNNAPISPLTQHASHVIAEPLQAIVRSLRIIETESPS